MNKAVGEVWTNRQMTSSFGLQHMNTPVSTDQQKLTFLTSMRILDAVQETSQELAKEDISARLEKIFH